MYILDELDMMIKDAKQTREDNKQIKEEIREIHRIAFLNSELFKLAIDKKIDADTYQKVMRGIHNWD